MRRGAAYFLAVSLSVIFRNPGSILSTSQALNFQTWCNSLLLMNNEETRRERPVKRAPTYLASRGRTLPKRRRPRRESSLAPPPIRGKPGLGALESI